MKVQHIIGADISKETIDFVRYHDKVHFKIKNDCTGFRQLLKWMQHLRSLPDQSLVVMEHTGFYSHRFENFLHQHHIAFSKVPALAIKQSLGLIRGKTDKLDATRIATYGYEKMATLSACVAVGKNLKCLQMLYATRSRLVKQRAALRCAIEEYMQMGLRKKDPVIAVQLSVIKTLDKQIKTVLSEMEALVREDLALQENFRLLVSIKGVGKVVAVAVLIKTQNFTRFDNPRKFACYCGIAPFEHSSGKSLRRKTRVSHLADKEMKCLLNISAQVAAIHDQELRRFYVKRTENGKSKMSTINIVRNKIVYRMFAVIKRRTPFVDNYLQAA